jgi:hypothetical protein
MFTAVLPGALPENPIPFPVSGVFLRGCRLSGVLDAKDGGMRAQPPVSATLAGISVGVRAPFKTGHHTFTRIAAAKPSYHEILG